MRLQAWNDAAFADALTRLARTLTIFDTEIKDKGREVCRACWPSAIMWTLARCWNVFVLLLASVPLKLNNPPWLPRPPAGARPRQEGSRR